MSAFFDSGVLAALFDADIPLRQEAARRLFEWHARAGDMMVSPQVLAEFYLAVTRDLAAPLPVEDAAMALVDLGEFPCVPVDASLVLAAAQRSRGDALAYRDALVLEAALRAGADLLYSSVLPAGRRFGSLVVEDPFAGLPA